MNSGTDHAAGSSRAALGGWIVQKLGQALCFCIEVEKLFDGGTHFEVAGALLVQERAAQARVQFGGPLKQGFHGFGGWRRHVATVLGLAEPFQEPCPDVTPLPAEGALGQPEDAAVSAMVKPAK